MELSPKEKLAICKTCSHRNPFVGTCGTPLFGKVVTANGVDVDLCGCNMFTKLNLFPDTPCPLKKF